MPIFEHLLHCLLMVVSDCSFWAWARFLIRCNMWDFAFFALAEIRLSFFSHYNLAISFSKLTARLRMLILKQHSTTNVVLQVPFDHFAHRYKWLCLAQFLNILGRNYWDWLGLGVTEATFDVLLVRTAARSILFEVFWRLSIFQRKIIIF